MPWTCLQLEERLSDYLEQALTPQEAREFEAHVGDCANCAPLLAQVRGMLARMQQIEELDPPLHLVPQILDQTLGPRLVEKGLGRWLRALRPIFQPQFGLGAAAVLATLFLVVNTLVPVRMKKADLHPSALLRNADRQAHLVYAHGAKFVNDLRVVYEIQSRLRPESSPAQEPERPAPPSTDPQQKSQGDHKNGRSANRNFSVYACALWPTVGGNLQ
jgi:anti-sigma factor RsiW